MPTCLAGSDTVRVWPNTRYTYTYLNPAKVQYQARQIIGVKKKEGMQPENNRSLDVNCF